jgi:hypothetical protein
MATRSYLAKRVAAIEKAKAPPPVIRWSPWQRILTPKEDAFARVLAHRGARRRGERGENLSEDDRGPPRVLLAAVPVRHDRLEPDAVGRGHVEGGPLAHGAGYRRARQIGML